MTTEETKSDGPAVLSSALLAVAYTLYLNTWLQEGECVEEMDAARLEQLGKKWHDEWLPGMTEAHSGDCTKQCWPCLRCSIESLIANAGRVIASSNA